MMYQIRRTNQSRFGKSFFKILTIFLLIAGFILTVSFFEPAHSFISDALSPLFRSGNFFYASLGKIPDLFSDENKIIEENTRLLSEIENLRLNIVDYDSLKYENQRLREELKIRPIGKVVSASVIAKFPQVPLDSLFIDRGTEDGINKGDLVLAGDRILIGRIAEVFRNKATVALNSFAGTVSFGSMARTDEPIEIKGAGGGNIEAKVPIDFDIVVGDKIILKDSLNYQAATVGVVEEDSSAGFKDILMSLPVDIYKINTVFIKAYINE